MNPKQMWPKKMGATQYAKRWYTDRCAKSVINDIKRGLLPGGQEENKSWFVWVHADFTPAHEYQAPETSSPAGSRTGNTLADKVLARLSA